MAVKWNHYEDPDDSACERIIQEIETELGTPVHDVVKKHLRERRSDPSHAFPRFEDHVDQYLFGHLYLPTAIDDGIAEFAELIILATPMACWTVLRVPSESVSDIQVERITNDRQPLSRYRRKDSGRW